MHFADEDHAVGKQVWSTRQPFVHRRAAVTGCEFTPQRLVIDRDARATAIQQLRRGTAVSRQEFDQRWRQLRVHRPADSGAALKKATASASSRVRCIGGRLRQMRLP
ncbi:MAG: hypothetical protein AW07_02925 [Candidatus Accumulibacter sp. SK-11]|nr:MAG: hypothetical protein AW07_02925 [Candidatus Accumulibacter sp. SK-11]